MLTDIGFGALLFTFQRDYEVLVHHRIKKVKIFIIYPFVRFVTFRFACVQSDLLVTILFSHSRSLKSQGL